MLPFMKEAEEAPQDWLRGTLAPPWCTLATLRPGVTLTNAARLHLMCQSQRVRGVGRSLHLLARDN